MDKSNGETFEKDRKNFVKNLINYFFRAKLRLLLSPFVHFENLINLVYRCLEEIRKLIFSPLVFAQAHTNIQGQYRCMNHIDESSICMHYVLYVCMYVPVCMLFKKYSKYSQTQIQTNR